MSFNYNILIIKEIPIKISVHIFKRKTNNDKNKSGEQTTESLLGAQPMIPAFLRLPDNMEQQL